MKTGMGLLALAALLSALGSVFMPEVFYATLLFKILFSLIILNMLLCTSIQVIHFDWKMVNANRLVSVKKLGILILHLGIIFMIAGGGLHLIFGKSMTVKLIEGETADISKLITVSKPFAIYLKQFEIQYNEDGSPSQYYSHFQISEGGETRKNISISVNHPITYGNIKIYQQGYGYRVRIRVIAPNQADSESFLAEGETLPVLGTENEVYFYRYIPNYDPKNKLQTKTVRPDNPRVVFCVYQNNELLNVGTTKIGEHIKLDQDSDIVFTEIQSYTVFKIKNDPGLPVTALGSVAFMIGVLMAFLSGGRLQKLNSVSQKEFLEN